MALDKKARLETDSSYEIGQLKAQINDLYETHFLIRFPILIKSVTDQMMALDKKARLETDSSYEIGQLKAQINDLYETHFLIRFPILNLKIKRFKD